MHFGQALESLHAGERVHRPGWHGKHQWLKLLSDARAVSGDVHVAPFIAIWADGHFVPWTASQSDLLATDWEIDVVTAS